MGFGRDISLNIILHGDAAKSDPRDTEHYFYLGKQCTAVRFASLLSGGFATMAVIKETHKSHLCAMKEFQVFDVFFKNLTPLSQTNGRFQH